MKRIVFLIAFIISWVGAICTDAQTISDSGYRTVAHIRDDGTIQDAAYRTIGHARNIPVARAALFFFFME